MVNKTGCTMTSSYLGERYSAQLVNSLGLTVLIAALVFDSCRICDLNASATKTRLCLVKQLILSVEKICNNYSSAGKKIHFMI